MKFVEIADVELEMIEEGYVQIAGRSGNKIVRKFRCTSGSRRGRIVNLKKAKRRKGSVMKIKSARTKRARKTTQRLKKMNVHSRSMLKPRKQTARRR